MILREIKLFICDQVLYGIFVTFLHILCYLVGVQNESLPPFFVTTTLILTILNIVRKCVIWINMSFYTWIIHGDQTKVLSMVKLNSGLLHPF